MDRLKRVVVGIDFSPRSLAAAEIGKALAGNCQAELIVLHSIENPPDEGIAESVGIPLDQLLQTVRDEARSRLNAVAESLNYPRTTQRITFGAASEALMDLCEDSASTLLVVGDLGQSESSGRRLLGSTARQLLNALQCRVFIARPLRRGAIKRIAAAVDLESECDEILEQARRLASATGAAVDVVSVMSVEFAAGLSRILREDQIEAVVSDAVKKHTARLRKEVEKLEWGEIKVRLRVLPGSAGSKLVEFARSHRTDVVVLGAVPLPGLARYFVGSTAQQVIEHTYCSVLVVKI